MPVAPTLRWQLPERLLRGAANPGKLLIHNGTGKTVQLGTLTLACAEPGITVHAEARELSPANGESVELPFTLTIAPAAAVRRVLLLAAGALPLGGTTIELPPPFTVTTNTPPKLTGDVMLVTISGTVSTSLATPPAAQVTIGIPAACRLDGDESIVLPPLKPNTPTPFAANCFFTREQACRLRGPRDEGVPITLKAQGFDPIITSWRVPIDHFQRAPQHLGSISGGQISLQVNNFSDLPHQVALCYDAYPGWAGGAYRQTLPIAAGESATFTHPVHWADARQLDPGYVWLAMRASVDDREHDAGQMFLDQELEQSWYFNAHEQLPAEAEGKDEEWDAAQIFSMTPAQAEEAGWKRLLTGSVCWYDEITEQLKLPKSFSGLLVAATQLHASKDEVVHVGYYGNVQPAAIIINGKEIPAKKLPAPGEVTGEGITLHAGVNTLLPRDALPAAENRRQGSRRPGETRLLRHPARTRQHNA